MIILSSLLFISSLFYASSEQVNSDQAKITLNEGYHPKRNLQSQSTDQNSWQDQLYTSLPVNQIDLKQICNYGQMIDINPLSSLSQGKIYFFANLVECGFALFDATDPLQLQLIYSNREMIPQKLQILADGYLYVSSQSGSVMLYDISKPISPKLITKIVTTTIINDYHLNVENNLLFFLSGKNIYIYSYLASNLSNMQMIQKIQQNDIVGGIQFYKSPTTQELFFLIGSPYLHIYQVVKSSQSNSNTLLMTDICEVLDQRITGMLLIESRYLYLQTFFAGIYLLDIENAVTTLKSDCVSQVSSVSYLFGNYMDISGLLQIGSGNNKLMASVAIYGLYMFDIDAQNGAFDILQHIQIEGVCNSLGVTNLSTSTATSNLDLIIYSSEDSLLIFQKTKVNDYLDIPNLLNLHQATLNNEKYEAYTWAYHCLVDLNTGTLFTTSDANGMFAISPSTEFSLDAFLLSYHNTQKIPLLIDWDAAEGLAIHPKSKHIFVGQGIAGLMVFDFSDLDNLVTIATTDFGFTNAELDAIKASSDGNILIFAGGYQGLLVVSVQDLKNPRLLSNLYTENPKNAECKNVAFGKNDRIAFATYRYYGVVAIDIGDAIDKQNTQDVSTINLVQLSLIVTQGAEDLILTSDRNFIILSDAFRGITIIDVTNPKNMKIVSNVHTEGWSLHLKFSDSTENYLISNSREFGQLFLLDISNKAYPRVIQKYKYLNQDGSQDICLSPDNKTGYMLSTQGIVLLSLQSKLLFHFDFFIQQAQTTNMSNSVQVPIIPQNSIGIEEVLKVDLVSSMSIKLHDLSSRGLQVGENITVKMAQIFPSSSMSAVSVSKAMSYSNYQLADLPYWIIFNGDNLTLTINVTKDALANLIQDKSLFPNNNPDVLVSENWIVLIIQEQVTSYDFIKDKGEIVVTETMADQIISDCMDLDLVSENNFVNEQINDKVATAKLRQYNPTLYVQKMQTSSYSITLVNFILSVLKKKVTYYPIQFFTQSSLTVNLYDQEQQCITTVGQNSISIFLTVNTTQASFVDKKYQGVVVSLSQQEDTLKLEGQLDLMNNVLAQGIKLHLWDGVSPSDVIVNIEVQDGGQNNSVIKQFTVSSSFIISINQPTLTSQNSTIQKDLNNIYPDGKISILDKFSYTFPESIFIDEDSPILSYSIRIIQGSDNLTNSNNRNAQSTYSLPQGYWLTFSSNERTFQGTPASSNFLDDVTIVVSATDGYFVTEESFRLQIVIIPFTYILYLSIQILGPILGLLGMWKYKSLIYNMVMKQSTILSPHIVMAGNKLQIQIPLLEYEIQTVQKIMHAFIQSIDKNKLILQINQAKQSYYNFQYALHFNHDFDDADNNKKYAIDNDNDNEEFPANTSQKSAQSNYPKVQDLILQSKDETNDYSKFHKMNSIFYVNNKQENYNLRTKSPSATEIDNIDNSHRTQSNQIKRLAKVKFANQQKVERLRNVSIGNRQQETKKRALSISNYNQDEERQHYKMDYFDKNGELNKCYIMESLERFLQKQSFIIQGVSQMHMENIRMSLQNKTQTFQRLLMGIFSIFLSESDVVTSEIIKFIKQYSIQKHTANDWYKEYVIIQPTFDNIFQDVFPKLSLNYDNLKAALQQLISISFSPNRDNSQQVAKNLNCGPEDALIPLIEQALYAQTLGITFQPVSFIPKPRGESLVVQPNKVRSVKVYIPSTTEKGISNKIKKYFNLDQEYEMSLVENQKLPHWIKSVDVRNNTILIDGMPTEKDTGNYLLKIFDDQYFVIRSQTIKVISNPNLSQKDKSETQQIITNTNTIINIEPDIPSEDNNQGNIFSSIQFSRKAKENKKNTVRQDNISDLLSSVETHESPNRNIEKYNQCLTSKSDPDNLSQRFMLTNRSDEVINFNFTVQTQKNEE